MYQWREWQVAGRPAPQGFGRLAPPRARPTLVVDLSQRGANWWRGVATLALLCGGAGTLAPAPAALPGDVRASHDEANMLADLALAPARSGGASGGRMAASPAVEPLLDAPQRKQVDLTARLAAGDRLGALLVRLGADPAGAAQADALLRANAPSGVEPGTPVTIRLGERNAAGRRSVERVALRATLALHLTIARAADGGLAAQVQPIAVDDRPRRVRGLVGDGLYWSLRAAGVEPATAADYLKALATQVDVGADLAPSDGFDLIVANRRAATGENRSGGLLYAAIVRGSTRPVQLMKWTVGGRPGWYDATDLSPVTSSAFGWPVAAPVTSNFGMRVHPILRYARMHRGMDFGARWGTPITASADGQVSSAGWAGGYGQQVRIAHAGGIASSYSHMSRMVVEPGMLVRAGQLIGYVGSTGLSTGPHLHYEIYKNGVAVDPRSVRFALDTTADAGELQRYRARLRALLSSARG